MGSCHSKEPLLGGNVPDKEMDRGDLYMFATLRVVEGLPVHGRALEVKDGSGIAGSGSIHVCRSQMPSSNFFN